MTPEQPQPAEDTKKSTVTTRPEAAKLLGVTTRTLTDWSNEPGFPGRIARRGCSDGHFPIAEIQAWHEQRFGDLVDAAEPRSSRDRKDSARADILELERDKLRGDLISTEEVERLHQRVASGARSVLEQLPDRLCSGAAEEERPRLRRIGERVRDDMLAAMAELLNQENE